MLFKKKKDILIRKKVSKFEKLNLILNFLKRKIFLKKSKNLNFLILKKIQSLKNLCSKTKVVRRCILTNRGRAISRKYNISRIKLRDMLQSYVLPGYCKAVW